MTTKHTPGPWEAVGRDVLSMHAYPRASGPLVCVVDDNDNARWPADSALIAAAPDLLEMLELMAAQHFCGCRHPACNRCKDDDDCADVIAKAKGEKP